METRDRYSQLGLAEALNRHHDYPWACEELGVILRLAYSKLPKSLQALLFRDTLHAFRLLPEVQTSHGLSSANLLVQAVEASLPKQKRSAAVSEFKRAVVAHKRRGKAHQDEGSIQLPQDVLIHIFSFLDMRSLVNASSTCWAWHSAAADNTLWQLQHSFMFGVCDRKPKEKIYELERDKKAAWTDNIDWRDAFKQAYIGNLSWRSATHRVICGHCKSFIWLSCMTSSMAQLCCKDANQNFMIKPVSAHKVVDYLLGETDFAASSSDSDDSDSDGSSIPDRRMRKLWALPSSRLFHLAVSENAP